MFQLGYAPLFLLLLFWFRVLWLTLIKDFSSRGAEIRFHLAFKTSGKKKKKMGRSDVGKGDFSLCLMVLN